MTHRLEGQMEYDPESGGIFISLFPEEGDEAPTAQHILDAVSDLLMARWQNKIKEERKLDA